MTKLLRLLIIFFSIVCSASGAVNSPIYEADGNTPFNGRQIMVGTALTIIVESESDANAYPGMEWSYSLAFADANMDYGVLSAGDYNDQTMDFADARYPAAGGNAAVWEWLETGFLGFDLYASFEAVKGRWFIIDYTATAVGTCRVGFYDHDIDWYVPVYYLDFIQVPTRDFDGNYSVDSADFAILASNWMRTDCVSHEWCYGIDLNTDGSIDNKDLMLFADFWLEKTR